MNLDNLYELLREPEPLTMICAVGNGPRIQAAVDSARAAVDASRPFLSLPPRSVTVLESVAVEDPNSVIVVDPEQARRYTAGESTS